MNKEKICNLVQAGTALAMCVSASCAASSLLPNTKNKLFRILHPIGFALMISPVIYKSSMYWTVMAEKACDALVEDEEEESDG